MLRFAEAADGYARARTGFPSMTERYTTERLQGCGCLLKRAKNRASKIIGVLHYPPTNDKHQASDFTRLMEEYGVKTCVYGHLHGKDVFPNGLKGIYNGVEYRLVSLDYLQAKPEEVKI